MVFFLGLGLNADGFVLACFALIVVSVCYVVYVVSLLVV